MRLPLAVKAYAVGVAELAVLSWYAWHAAWPGEVAGGWSLWGMPLGPLGFAALTAIALLFPLPVSRSYKTTVAIAVDFASLLLFGPPAAMLTAGLGNAAANLILLRMGKRDRWNVLFNVGQGMLAVGLAGLIFYAIEPPRSPFEPEVVGPRSLFALVLAAGTLYLLNSFAVALAVGLQHRKNPLAIWLAGRRIGLPQSVALLLVGLVTALLAHQHPWAVVAMILPTAIIYLSLKRTVQLTEQTIAAVEALADVVDRRDRYTFEHSKRVADYAVRLARRMHLPGEEVETIRLAARVHDLGKIGVPDAVLHKPGRLTPEEWALMQQHPRIGYEILSRFPQYHGVRELVVSHHERFDGTGYPYGLHSGQLDLGAQIIAVADTLDAMTSERPYRRALSLDEALAEFRRLKGVQWHPDVVDALEQLVAQPRAVPARVDMPPAVAA